MVFGRASALLKRQSPAQVHTGGNAESTPPRQDGDASPDHDATHQSPRSPRASSPNTPNTQPSSEEHKHRRRQQQQQQQPQKHLGRLGRWLEGSPGPRRGEWRRRRYGFRWPWNMRRRRRLSLFGTRNAALHKMHTRKSCISTTRRCSRSRGTGRRCFVRTRDSVSSQSE